MSAHARTHIRETYRHRPTQAHIHTHTHTHTRTHAHAHTHTHAHTHRNAHTNTQALMHTHSQTHTNPSHGRTREQTAEDDVHQRRALGVADMADELARLRVIRVPQSTAEYRCRVPLEYP